MNSTWDMFCKINMIIKSTDLQIKQDSVNESGHFMAYAAYNDFYVQLENKYINICRQVEGNS